MINCGYMFVLLVLLLAQGKSTPLCCDNFCWDGEKCLNCAFYDSDYSGPKLNSNTSSKHNLKSNFLLCSAAGPEESVEEVLLTLLRDGREHSNMTSGFNISVCDQDRIVQVVCNTFHLVESQSSSTNNSSLSAVIAAFVAVPISTAVVMAIILFIIVRRRRYRPVAMAISFERPPPSVPEPDVDEQQPLLALVRPLPSHRERDSDRLGALVHPLPSLPEPEVDMQPSGAFQATLLVRPLSSLPEPDVDVQRSRADLQLDTVRRMAARDFCRHIVVCKLIARKLHRNCRPGHCKHCDCCHCVFCREVLHSTFLLLHLEHLEGLVFGTKYYRPLFAEIHELLNHWVSSHPGETVERLFAMLGIGLESFLETLDSEHPEFVRQLTRGPDSGTSTREMPVDSRHFSNPPKRAKTEELSEPYSSSARLNLPHKKRQKKP